MTAQPESPSAGPSSVHDSETDAPLHDTFVCPRDRGRLRVESGFLRCEHCATSFPLVNGVPLLINDENSVFAIADYGAGAGYAGASYGRAADRVPGLRRAVHRITRRLRDVQVGIGHFGHHDALAAVRRIHPRPFVLVVGSGGVRFGEPPDTVVHTDVAFGDHVDAVADAHDLPFPEAFFDLVIAVAVLEHVADPQRCVAEFWRVLRPDGHVFAVTPFLQPVHMGAYDFTRFTPLGHRRLFRHFDAVEQGVAIGVGSVVSWTLGALFESISGARLWRNIARAAALVFGPPLRALDNVLRAPSGRDAAGGSYFFGRRRADAIPDRTIIQEYRGGFRTPRFDPAPGQD